MPGRLHPAVPVLLYLALAVILPWLSLPRLAVLIVPALFSVRRGWRLLRRSRWLILMILVSYAWTLPGEALWAHVWSPSREGLEAGLMQIARLALLLMLLDAWVLRLEPERLLAAILALLRPFPFLPTERLAVRLALTLRALETPLPVRDIAAWYAPPLPDGSAVHVIRPSWTRFDGLWLAGSMTMLVGLAWLA